MKPLWVRESGSSGALGFAALAIAVASGVALALGFNPFNPYDSVALLLLTNPGGRFFRNVHYWSAQLLLMLLIVHTWRHIGRGSERKLSLGKWARAALLLPLAGFLMLSGFILKGDPEGLQALRILTTSIEQVPWIGHLLTVAMFGADRQSVQVVYVHHVATATLLTWLLVSEHARAIWPRLTSVVAAGVVSIVVGLIAAPAVHDGLSPILKGPWFFVGLQELFHHATRPGLVLAGASAVLALIAALPNLPTRAAAHGKVVLAGIAFGYAAITVFALFCRGQNWTLQPPAFAAASGVAFESPLRVPSLDAVRAGAVPVVLGRREGCLFCHAATTGLSSSHRPEAVGCASCHEGNPFSLDKAIAHRGVVLVPGNLDSAARTCGGSACHSAIVERVRGSIMTTMRGVISVDRATFGETHRVDAATVAGLGDSPADTHLRQLCVSCHLGASKRELGPIDEMSRGGGCNACHLAYSRSAVSWLAAYRRDKQVVARATGAMVHPDLSVQVTNDHCFGCHSRSGRISISYEGWHERATSTDAGPEGPTRTLADERVLTREQPDIHFDKGMLCVDCHTSREVMGDGGEHERKSTQASVACEDCHATQLASTTEDQADDESKRILAVRGRFQKTASALVTHRHGEVLTSTTVDAEGHAVLVSKQGAVELPLKPPASACLAGGAHARLSCIACHTAWSPRCSGCHTSFDGNGRAFDHLAEREVRGSWVESGADFRADAPTLGVRLVDGAQGDGLTVIDPFVPGMVLTINAPDSAGRLGPTMFRRLYARTFSHTISRQGRSCVSCHNEPVAVGYGRGELAYRRTPEGGRWTFVAERAQSPFDGLPGDAWIGFLERTTAPRSTRADVRPFDVDEQKRILTAGACLTCHRGDSEVMKQSVVDFEGVLRKITPRCVVPVWNNR